LLRQILILYIARDLLLAAGFFLRSRISLSPRFEALFAGHGRRISFRSRP
jgi:hypothetical protein